MKNSEETILDENGFEILVNYDYELDYAYHAEIGNPATFVPASVDDSSIKINSFEIVIGGTGIDIVSQLDKRQIDFIKTKLKYP